MLAAAERQLLGESSATILARFSNFRLPSIGIHESGSIPYRILDGTNRGARPELPRERRGSPPVFGRTQTQVYQLPTTIRTRAGSLCSRASVRKGSYSFAERQPGCSWAPSTLDTHLAAIV
jgi:hypothetical protein